MKKTCRHNISLWILLLNSYNVLAQVDSTVTQSREITIFGDFKTLVSETFQTGIGLTLSPFRKWDRQKSVHASVLIGTIALTYFVVDEPLNNFFNKQLTEKERQRSRTLSEVGNPLLVGSAILGFELLGHASGNTRLNRIAFLSAQSFATSMSFCYVTKHLSGRLRPSFTDNHDMWYGPNWNENPKRSFFSGHTTALFSFTTVVAMEHSHIGWVPPVLYILAGGAAVSRLATGDHWASDVVFPALFSHLVAREMVIRWRNKETNRRTYPILSAKSAGIRLIF